MRKPSCLPLLGSLLVLALSPALSAPAKKAAPPPPEALPAAPAAKVVQAAGKTTVSGKTGSRPAKSGDAVSDGETLKTGPKSSAIVEYPDGSRVKLRSETAFKFEIPAENSGVKGGLLSIGSIFAKVVKGERGHFRMRTGTAVAAVRGT
ncbi:MAG: hypothetical protein FD126_2591, partial [Elusimicrobia bacterium]